MRSKEDDHSSACTDTRPLLEVNQIMKTIPPAFKTTRCVYVCMRVYVSCDKAITMETDKVIGSLRRLSHLVARVKSTKERIVLDCFRKDMPRLKREKKIIVYIALVDNA